MTRTASWNKLRGNEPRNNFPAQAVLHLAERIAGSAGAQVCRREQFRSGFLSSRVRFLNRSLRRGCPTLPRRRAAIPALRWQANLFAPARKSSTCEELLTGRFDRVRTAPHFPLQARLNTISRKCPQTESMLSEPTPHHRATYWTLPSVATCAYWWGCRGNGTTLFYMKRKRFAKSGSRSGKEPRAAPVIRLF